MKTIGLELKGTIEQCDGYTIYHMSEEEKKLEKEGKIAIIGITICQYGPSGSSKTHNYTMVNMTQATHIDIFYDIEDDYMMDQTITFKDGQTVYGRSRDHQEVERWEALGIPISKSYGW